VAKAFILRDGRASLRITVVCAGLVILQVPGCLSTTHPKADVPVKFATQVEQLGIVWKHFLKVMMSGDDNAVHAECTEAGYQALQSYISSREPHAAQWQRWSTAWSKWGPVRWESITSLIAYGRLGPKQHSAAINFALTPQGWKFDYVSPAD
jgi:hypothetical protein